MQNNPYSIFDLGFDAFLKKPGFDIVLPSLQTVGFEGQTGGGTDLTGATGQQGNPLSTVNPGTIQAGELGALIGHGKKTFSDTQAGWLQGLDSDGTYKWIIGNDTNSADWNVTTANTFTVNGVIVATTGGRIANWYINTDTISSSSVESTSSVLLDSANSLIRLGATAGNYITLDGTNLRMRSSNYVADVSGFTIEPTLIESENIVGRATLKGAVFSYDVVSAIGGQLLVTNADTLDADTTALDASTLTTKGTTTFAVNDILLIRAITSLGIQEEYLRVTNIGSAPTYTVTRDLAGSFTSNINPIWKKGTAIVKVGSSDGSSTYSGGWLKLIGEGTNAPYYSVFKRTGLAYNAYTEYSRFGNLNGFLGYASDEYGIAIGETSKYLKYDPTNGLEVTNSNIINTFTTGENITAGNSVIVGNASGYTGETMTTNEGQVGIISGTGWLGQSFTTSASAIGINAVTLYLQQSGGPNTVTISIRSSLTGADIESKTATQVVTSSASYTFTFSTSVTVSPSSVYYVVIRESSDNSSLIYGKLSTGSGLSSSTDSGANWTGEGDNEAIHTINESYTVAGLLYKSDASANNEYLNFIGFATETKTAGNTCKVNLTNINQNQTGLTVGVPYYLSDTPGAISTSAGSVSKKIGLSLSATSILILNN